MTRRHAYSLPKTRVLKWLTQAGLDVPTGLHQFLLGEIFTEPKAVVAGSMASTLVCSTAFVLHGGVAYLLFIALEAALLLTRLWLGYTALQKAVKGAPTATDACLFAAISWCALQGSIGFLSMQSNDNRLQMSTSLMTLAMVGPICARNYAAPRYAMVLVGLVTIPNMYALISVSDRWRWVFLVHAPLFLWGTNVVVWRFNRLAVAALRSETESLFRAHHDSLTGLLNRVGLESSLPGCCLDSKLLTLFYLDLDGFKPVNDTFGHHAGDLVLVEVGRRLQSKVRESDLAARLGGDEFVIVCPGVTPHLAEIIARELVACISSTPYAVESAAPVRIGVSIGYACAPEDATELDALRRKADEALYEAKGSGRGTFRRFGAPDRRTHSDLAELSGLEGRRV